MISENYLLILKAGTSVGLKLAELLNTEVEGFDRS